MKKIVGVLKPFNLHQNFYLYEDGVQIESAQPKVDEISDLVFSYMEKYQIEQLDLLGPKQYLKGLSLKIKEKEKTKFNKNTLKINII